MRDLKRIRVLKHVNDSKFIVRTEQINSTRWSRCFCVIPDASMCVSSERGRIGVIHCYNSTITAKRMGSEYCLQSISKKCMGEIDITAPDGNIKEKVDVGVALLPSEVCLSFRIKGVRLFIHDQDFSCMALGASGSLRKRIVLSVAPPPDQTNFIDRNIGHPVIRYSSQCITELEIQIIGHFE